MSKLQDLPGWAIGVGATFIVVALFFGYWQWQRYRLSRDSDRTGHMTVIHDGEEFLIATASESRARAATVLPMKPSEDASHLLGKIEINAIQPPSREEYLPLTTVEWVITVEFPSQPRLVPKKVDALFDQEWQDKWGHLTIYGLDADTKRWTFLISGDGPKAVTKLKLAWDYVDPIRNEIPPATKAQFESRIAESRTKLKAYGEPKFEVSESTENAAKRSLVLRELKSSLDYSPILALKAPKEHRFDGKTIWDVMLCLGLNWGDMDCFQWNNPSRNGDDHFFWVSTSTPPGYFLPEQIAADRVHVEDLVFEFSVPRSAAPVQVFDAMVKAVQYCQKRLGGMIVDETQNAADMSAIRARILETEQKLRQAGFAPGTNNALRLF
jgi:FtsZ-interacting cell division protein ZipA